MNQNIEKIDGYPLGKTVFFVEQEVTVLVQA